MQPGDIYNPNPNLNSSSPAEIQTRSAFPSSVTYPARLNPTPHPYNDPPPPPIHPSQSQPFPSNQTRPLPPPFVPASRPQQQQGYDDPFADGTHHYPSQPNLTSHTRPMHEVGIPSGPRMPLSSQAFPPYPPNPQNQSQTYPANSQQFMPSPPQPLQHLSPPRLQTQRARFDSTPNMSYQSSNSYPYGLADNRLASPPPMIQHHSSSSTAGIGYPPRNPYDIGPPGAEDDINDSAPLLSHAAPDPRFGIPQTNSAMSLRPDLRFQLSDPGYGHGSDIGAMTGRDGGSEDEHMHGDGNGYMNGHGNGYMNGNGNSYGGGEDDEPMVHYGPVPARVLRRNRTQKRIA